MIPQQQRPTQHRKDCWYGCFLWGPHQGYVSEGQQRFGLKSVSEWEWESQQSLPSIREWPAEVRPLLSSKRRPNFKTCKSLKWTKIWHWVLTEPETKNDCAGEGQQQFTGVDSQLRVGSRGCELVMGESPAGKDVSMEAEESHSKDCNQAMPNKDDNRLRLSAC
jgi:hypothetical protein